MKKSCWLKDTLSGPSCCRGLLTLEERGNKEREMSGDYDVAVSSKSISHFKNTKLPIEYWIALEPDSVFDAG